MRFSSGNEVPCTRSFQGESSLSLPGAAESRTEGEGRERKALAPSRGTPGLAPRGGRAPTFRRARPWALSAPSRPQPAPPSSGPTEPPQAAPVSGTKRGSGVSLSGPPRRGRLPCPPPPPRDSPFAAAILFPASAATAPRTGLRPGPSHPLVQAPHPQLHQPLGALPVAILSGPPSSAPAPPPPPSRHFVAAPSLSPWPCTAFPASAHHRSARPAQPTWPDRRGPPDRPCRAGGAASGTARGGWKPMGLGGSAATSSLLSGQIWRQHLLPLHPGTSASARMRPVASHGNGGSLATGGRRRPGPRRREAAARGWRGRNRPLPARLSRGRNREGAVVVGRRRGEVRGWGGAGQTPRRGRGVWGEQRFPQGGSFSQGTCFCCPQTLTIPLEYLSGYFCTDHRVCSTHNGEPRNE